MTITVPPWMLVIIGILFNIVSALITSHFIDMNNKRIHSIQSEEASVDLRINSFWQNRQDMERKREFFLLFLHTQDVNEVKSGSGNAEYLNSYVRHYLEELTRQYELNSAGLESDDLLSAKNVSGIIEQAQQQLIAWIDDIYLEKILLEKRRQPIENRNSTLISIALFRQLVGLIMVLARDLQRH